jgi:topoisomerase-4 subunit A
MATNIPPHNLDELLRACEHLIKTPDARDDTLLNYVQGPDFPTGGVIVEPPDRIAEAYRTGRGAFRLRATWEVEDLGRGNGRSWSPRSPTRCRIQADREAGGTDPDQEGPDPRRCARRKRRRHPHRAGTPLEERRSPVLMGTLFRNSDLETRFSLNMNVLIDGRTPKVCSLKEVLRAFLDHRRDVLIRRSKHRMAKIDHRLEVLEGFIIAFLNLDRVIDIIRYDEMPKAALMREDWSRDFTRATSEADYVTPPPGRMGELTEVQAEAILNMRLRSLRRLEEMELLRERDALMEERADLDDLLAEDGLQWDASPRSCARCARPSAPIRGRRAAHPIRRGGRSGGSPARGDDRPRAGDDRLFRRWAGSAP